MSIATEVYKDNYNFNHEAAINAVYNRGFADGVRVCPTEHATPVVQVFKKSAPVKHVEPVA